MPGNCEKKTWQAERFMIRFSNASKEGWGGVPARAEHDYESWVVDGKRVEQYSTEHCMSSCNLCI